jgi:photosystem II stability/assembly factor-like uncharacterized protein
MTEETLTPYGVYALAASPAFNEDGICFAACRNGLFRSEDGGESWAYAYETLNLDDPLTTLAVVVSPSFTSDESVFAGAPGGILRSMNGGQSWSVTMLPTPPPIVSALAISPNYARDGVLLAGTMEDGVFRSAYRGVHFSRWNFGLLDLHVLAVEVSPDYAKDETIYLGTETGVFRSTNGGRAWREAALSMDLAPVLSLAISPNYKQDGTLLAGTESHGLQRSTDRGQSWTAVVEGDLVADEAVNGLLLSPDYPDKPHILMMTSTRLLISRDDGQSWDDWKEDFSAEQGLASVSAPLGLDEGAPILTGLVEGSVLRL